VSCGKPGLGLDVFRSLGPPSHDLAFESDMLERASGGRCTLLVMSWRGPVVVLGYAQPPDDVDLRWCREQRIPVLRRLSGGTGVVHRNDLGVSLALPNDHPWAGAIVGLYDRLLEVLESALVELGSRVERPPEAKRSSRVRSPICFEDQLADTLLLGGRKVVGCSQVRRRTGVLIHAAILLGLDAQLVARVFRVDEERVCRGMAPAVLEVGWESAADAVIAGLAAALDLETLIGERPDPSGEFLEVFQTVGRWAPVPDGGIR
jgi:lipoate-protein ligase A